MASTEPTPGAVWAATFTLYLGRFIRRHQRAWGELPDEHAMHFMALEAGVCADLALEARERREGER